MASLAEIWGQVSGEVKDQETDKVASAEPTEQEIVEFWNSLPEEERTKIASEVAEEVETEESMAKFAEAYELGKQMAIGFAQSLSEESSEEK